jgi:hypothetical protein
MQMKTDILDTAPADRTERIARLNDRARNGLDRSSRIVVTSGLHAQLAGEKPADAIFAQARLIGAMRRCTFQTDSPERDFASFEVDGIKILMKIDYYDAELIYGSEDPADASITRRVVTLMRAEDY